MIQRHQHLGAGLFRRRQDHLLARQRVRHDRPAPPDGLAREPCVRVEPERRPPPLSPSPAGRGVRDQFHLIRAGVVAREPHLLPGHEPPCELLNTGEALGQADVRRDRLRQALDQRQLVRPHRAADHRGAHHRRDRQHASHGKRVAGFEPRVRQPEPHEGEPGGAGVHDRLPARGEPRVDPGQRTAQRKLEVIRRVDGRRQHRQENCQRGEIRRGEGARPHDAAQPLVHETGHGAPGREVRRVAKGRSGRQAAQPQVPDQHRERRDQERERPAMVEDGVSHDAQDVRGEPVAGKGNPVAPRQRPDHDEGEDLRRHVRDQRRPPGSVCRDRSTDRGHRAQRHERPHQQTRRRLEAGQGTHADSRKVGPLARRVKRDYRLAHACHHRILRRLKLRAQGRRSGGRNPEDLSARRREADSIVRRRVRSRGGRTPHLLQEEPRTPRRAGGSGAVDQASQRLTVGGDTRGLPARPPRRA